MNTPQSTPQDSQSSEQGTGGLERFLHGLFLSLLGLAVLVILVWFDIRFISEVVSRQPIGGFKRMSGPGGLLGRVVIETDKGSYPLQGMPSIPKGTPLVLEVRATGAQFICDESRSLCIQTVRDQFKNTDMDSTPKESAIPPQGHTP